MINRLKYWLWKIHYNRLRNRMFNKIVKEMKKATILLMILFTGCKCLLSQIPPQYLYVDNDCQAVLPNYVEKVAVSDNCQLATVIQTPSPGFLLNSTVMSTNVNIKATDIFGNSSQVNFTVSLVDTIAPVINYDALLGETWQEVNNLYDRADMIIANLMEYTDDTFPYADFGVIKDDADSTYYKRIMLTWTGRGHAKTGKGYRFWTFPMPFDTLIFNHW